MVLSRSSRWFITAAFLAFPAATSGAVGGYAFDGGTKNERETVVAALSSNSREH